MSIIRIYLANLAAYNAGKLEGQWLDLPMDEDELREVINELTNNGKHDFAILDWETDYKIEISEYSDPYDLNNLAETIDELKDWEQEDIMYIMEAVDDFEEALDVLKNGNYVVFHECYSYADVAREYIEMNGTLDELGKHKEWVERYFDYEKYGRDMRYNGILVDCGKGIWVWVYE